MNSLDCLLCGENHDVKECPLVCSRDEISEVDEVEERCAYCSKMGHHINYCPKVICKRCGEGGHTAKVCRNPKRKFEMPKCSRCLRTGHTEQFCWKCERCQGFGHTTENCFQKIKNEPTTSPTIFDDDDFPPIRVGDVIKASTAEKPVIKKVSVCIDTDTVKQLQNLGVEIPSEIVSDNTDSDWFQDFINQDDAGVNWADLVDDSDDELNYWNNDLVY